MTAETARRPKETSMRRLILTAVLAVLASPVLAQEASPTAETPAAPDAVAAPAKSTEELAIEAEAKAFSEALVKMQQELVVITTPEEGDAVVARYQPQADALADHMSVYLLAYADRPENAAEREALLSDAAKAVASVRGFPAFIRSAVDQAVARGNARAAAAEAAQAAPEPAPASDAAPASADPSA